MYFENIDSPCLLKLCDSRHVYKSFVIHVMHEIFWVRLFAEVCIYGTMYTYDTMHTLVFCPMPRHTDCISNSSILGNTV